MAGAEREKSELPFEGRPPVWGPVVQKGFDYPTIRELPDYPLDTRTRPHPEENRSITRTLPSAKIRSLRFEIESRHPVSRLP